MSSRTCRHPECQAARAAELAEQSDRYGRPELLADAVEIHREGAAVPCRRAGEGGAPAPYPPAGPSSILGHPRASGAENGSDRGLETENDPLGSPRSSMAGGGRAGVTPRFEELQRRSLEDNERDLDRRAIARGRS